MLLTESNNHSMIVRETAASGDRQTALRASPSKLSTFTVNRPHPALRKDPGMTSPTRDRVLFGASYYLEYQPSPRLETDLDLMVEAGFSAIRVGESVWSTWEPEEGR